MCIRDRVNDIQNLISDGVDLLVVAAIDGEALNTVMDEAKDAGIPVISYDRLIKSDAVSYYISFDNYTVGTLQGQYVIDTPVSSTNLDVYKRQLWRLLSETGNGRTD